MNEDSKKKDQFNELMKPWNTFLNDTPLKGFLQSIDELFNKSFPFHSGFLVETSETDTEYKINAELPGVNKEQIGIDVFERSITITVQSHEDVLEEDDKRKTFKRQQSFQKSSRTIPFPSPINEKLVKASHKDGLLQITVPKQKGKPSYLD